MSAGESSMEDGRAEGSGSYKGRSVSPRDKAAAVLRVLSGEETQQVADSLDVSVRRVNEWKANFLEAGQSALKTNSRKQHLAERAARRTKSITQWILLIVVLGAIIFGLVALLQRQPGS